MGKKQHDKQHCGTGQCPRCHERNASAVPFLFVGLAPGWTLTITDSESKLWFQTTLARGSEVTGRLPICEILTFQLDRTGARSTTGTFYASAGVSLDLSLFTKAKEPETFDWPDWAVDKHGAIECKWCGADSGYGAGKPSDYKAALRAHLHNRGCSLSPQKDPTVAKPQEYPGLEYAGTAYGCRVHVGSSGDAMAAYKYKVCDWGHGASEYREGALCGNAKSMGETPNFACTPEVLAALDTWAEWTERVCHRCGETCTEFTRGKGGPRCLPCTRGETPTKREKAVVKVVKEAAEKLAPAFAEIADYVQREKVWGDMRTPREPSGGTLFATGESGHARLYLERLSNDREKALKQAEDASYEASCAIADQKTPALEKRMADIEATFCALHTAIDVGWDPEPRVQAIRDAHEAIGIEREWQAGRVEGARDCTAKGEFATVKITGAGWRFA